MEQWQMKYITNNLQGLIRMTNCSIEVQTILTAERILSEADKSSLVSRSVNKYIIYT